MKTPVIINGWKTIAMINSDAIGNFMSFLFAQQSNIQIKIYIYGLEMADGLSKMANKKTITLPIIFEQHYKTINFHVFGWAAHNVILNIFWLKTHCHGLNSAQLTS